VGRHAGKKALRRPRHSWEYNIKVGLKDIVFVGGFMSWVLLAEI
jgi:hypothetical protein